MSSVAYSPPMAIISILLTAIIIIVSILIVLIVLVQRPKQEGLGAAFGGGTFDAALGAHTTDILQKITTYFAITFFVSAIGLAMVKARQFSVSPANDVLENVDKKEAPPLPSGISDIPGTGAITTPAPIVPQSLLPETVTPTPKVETPTPAPEADAPAPEVAPAAPAPETPKGKGKAKSDGGKAKGEKGGE